MRPELGEEMTRQPSLPTLTNEGTWCGPRVFASKTTQPADTTTHAQRAPSYTRAQTHRPGRASPTTTTTFRAGPLDTAPLLQRCRSGAARADGGVECSSPRVLRASLIGTMGTLLCPYACVVGDHASVLARGRRRLRGSGRPITQDGRAPVRATRLAMVSLSVCQRCSGRRGQLIAAGS